MTVLRHFGWSLLFAAVAACASPDGGVVADQGNAITFGQQDTTHAAVGSLMWFTANPPIPENFAGGCSGTLVAPRVFLTAAHCVFEPDPGLIGYIGFGEDLRTAPAEAFIPIAIEDLTAHPSWPGTYTAAPGVLDIGVVRLRHSPPGIVPAALPPPGLLTRMDQCGQTDGLTFTMVGYGLTEALLWDELGPRNYVTSGFGELLNREWIKTDTDPAHGFGGGCGGDSGGPIILDPGGLDGHFLPVGVFSFMEGEVDPDAPICNGEPNYFTRLDLPEVRAFVAAAGR